MNEKAFDAGRYLTKLKGRDYLEVKWRLLWLRTEHPDAVIDTELMRHEDGEAIFKARVKIPEGGEATGWGSETITDFGNYLEKAETKALGRALAALGYGTQFCEDFDFQRESEPLIVDAPIERRVSKGDTVATPAQVKAIYSIAWSEHELNTEELDQRCRETYGRPPAELTKREASDFIDRLKGTSQSRRAS